jgi:hypothetical protein
LWVLTIRLWLWSSGKFVPLATETRSDEGSLRRRIRRDQKEANHGRNPPSDRDTAGALGNAAAVADPAAIADPWRLADPAAITTDGDGEMMITGGVRERSSGSAVPAGAADVAEEKATSAEEVQLPFAGYQRLGERQLIQDLQAIKKVRDYERKFRGRPRFLEEVIRIQRARRAAESARVVPAYRPASARSGARGAEGGGMRGSGA